MCLHWCAVPTPQLCAATDSSAPPQERESTTRLSQTFSSLLLYWYCLHSADQLATARHHAHWLAAMVHSIPTTLHQFDDVDAAGEGSRAEQWKADARSMQCNFTGTQRRSMKEFFLFVHWQMSANSFCIAATTHPTTGSHSVQNWRQLNSASHLFSAIKTDLHSKDKTSSAGVKL